LKKRVEIESEIHKQDNQKSMNDNVLLLKDIKELRSKVKQLERKLQTGKNKKTELEKDIKSMSSNADPSELASLGKPRKNGNDDDEI